MVMMVVLIVLILVGILIAGATVADDLAQGKYDLNGSDGSKFTQATSTLINILEPEWSSVIMFCFTDLSNEHDANVALTMTAAVTITAVVCYGLIIGKCYC